MVGIELPTESRLPPGPRRELVLALHELYRGAGRPGLRRIAAEISRADDYPDTVSHETPAAILRGEVLPRWSKLECIVRQLVVWHRPRLKADEQVVRFLSLWNSSISATGPSADNPGDALLQEEPEADTTAIIRHTARRTLPLPSGTEADVGGERTDALTFEPELSAQRMAARRQAYIDLLGAASQMRVHVETTSQRHWRDMNIRLDTIRDDAVSVGQQASQAALLSPIAVDDAAMRLAVEASELSAWIARNTAMGDFSSPGDQFRVGEITGNPDLAMFDERTAEFLRLASGVLDDSPPAG